MDGTTYQAIVVNGQIQMPGNIQLPENAKVLVVVPSTMTAPVSAIRSPRLVHSEQAGDFQLIVKDVADAGV